MESFAGYIEQGRPREGREEGAEEELGMLFPCADVQELVRL